MFGKKGTGKQETQTELKLCESLTNVYRTELKRKVGASKNLLQAISQSKEGERTSRSLIMALEGADMTEPVSFEDQFKLPDLVSTEGGDQVSEHEKELLKPPQWPVNKPRKYIHTHFDKEKIKLGAALQREEQRKWAEDALQSKENIKDDEGIEEDTHKEQMKKERAERYAQRVRERKEEEEDETEKIENITESGMQLKGEGKAKETKKPHGSKRKVETMQQEVDEEEEEYEERPEESSRKRRSGCINP